MSVCKKTIYKNTSKNSSKNVSNWIKIIIYNEKQIPEVALFKNVSVDFIKGVYCAMYDPKHNKLRTATNCTIIESNILLKNCIKSDIICAWCSDCSCIHHFYHNEYEYYPEKVLNDQKKYNNKLKKNKNGQLMGMRKILTKQFFAMIHFGERSCTGLSCCFGENYIANWIIQFDSIDFLSGFETMRVRINNNCDIFKDNILYLGYVFDLCKMKICTLFVTYEFLHEDSNILLRVENCINKYLPKELVQLIIVYFRDQCGWFGEDDEPYEECLTICSFEDHCFIHENQNEKLELIHCLANISIEYR